MFKHLFVLTLLLGTASAASAQSAACGDRRDLVERLQGQYAEHLTAGGLQDTSGSQTVMEIWTSEETGTFTVLVSHPNGTSCVVATGTDFFKIIKAANDPSQLG